MKGQMKITGAVFTLVSCLLVAFSVTALANDMCSEPVETTSGLLRGTADPDTATCVFKGIPFAAPPVGELRWQSPQPAPSWSGVREATDFGGRCMQKGIAAWLINDVEVETTENCLYLNIWSPRNSGKFPVMVWIHGGGYTIGAASDYNADRLSQDGEVVVVTINYRLNIFGFFTHPALRDEDPNNSTGGQAILDMVAALEWVRDNIENFGGDPDNVTIFGESAGGAAVCTLFASPTAKGLFHQAIVESGGCEGSHSLEDGYERVKNAALEVGCDFDDLDCLRDVPAKKLLDASGGELGLGGWDPHHDDYVLTDTPLAMIRSGNYNKVPLMVGYNRDEAAKLLKLFPKFYCTRPAKYEKKLVKLGFSEDEAKKLAELYPLSEFKGRPVEAYGRMFGVNAMTCGEYKALLAAAPQQNDLYFYRFDYDDQKYGKYMGAFHGLEIPFIYGHLHAEVYRIKLYDEENIEGAEELARIIQGYWVNFAHSGNPNKDSLPAWPAFQPDSPKVQILDTHTRAESAEVIADRCAFWEEYEEEHGSALRILLSDEE